MARDLPPPRRPQRALSRHFGGGPRPSCRGDPLQRHKAPNVGGKVCKLILARAHTMPARHYLYEAANVLLTTVRRPSVLKSWGLKLMKRRGPKRARVAAARRLAILLGRIWKDKTHFDAVPA